MNFETVFTIGFLVFMVAVVAGGAYYAQQEIRRQQAEWQKWAAAREWKYEIQDPTIFAGLSAKPFGQGRSWRTSHVVTGVWANLDFALYQYAYTTGAGKTSRAHPCTVAQFRCDAAFPTLEIQRGRTLNLTSDIQFESARFNEAYDVRGPSERFAFDIVHPRFMADLLDDGLGRFHVTFEDGAITVWRDTELLRTQALSAVRALAKVVGHVPTHVWRDLGAEPPRLTDTGASPVS